MPIDSPDYTSWNQLVEIVGDTPKAQQATTEAPISRLGVLATSSLTYVTLLTYTVPADTVTVLYGLELYSDTFSKTHWRITFKGVVQWADKLLPTSLNIFFSEARVKAGDVILVEVLSTDGTALNTWAHMDGKEVS